jgi:hypothetical protein
VGIRVRERTSERLTPGAAAGSSVKEDHISYSWVHYELDLLLRVGGSIGDDLDGDCCAAPIFVSLMFMNRALRRRRGIGRDLGFEELFRGCEMTPLGADQSDEFSQYQLGIAYRLG